MSTRRHTDLHTLAVFTLMAVLLPGISAQNDGDQTWCTEGVVQQARECSSEYKTCQQGRWNAAICAVGVFDMESKTCKPSTPKCPEKARKKRSLRLRRQAQTAGPTDCSLSYSCPGDLTSPFVYPFWESCDSYILCERGVVSVVSCRFLDYTYYNPRTLSCEEFASQTNTCVNRLNTDLSPIRG